jgi:hypothetical protein
MSNSRRGFAMGLFSRKPDRGLQAELAKQANGARNLLGYALIHKETNPPAGVEGAALDLTIKENRDAVRDELVRLIREHQLSGCTEAEIGGVRLVPLAMMQPKAPVEDAAVCSAIAINSVNMITRVYYEQYPKYRPLYEMVDSLAKICCTGAAQTVGPDLPPEVVRTWPYFSQIFEEAKQSLTWLWPDV